MDAPRPSVSSGSAPTRAAPTARRPARTPQAKPPAKTNCDPPYAIDAEGHKHYKPECL
jgi:serine/threonine-protein kinase